MGNYTSFSDSEFEAFKSALKALEIVDGDFTTDEAVRAQQVEETIRNTVGKEADLEAKLYDGKLGTYDILYYVYYATAQYEGVDGDVILYASNMKEASAVKLQLGMTSTAGDLDTAIMEALKEKDIKDYLYKTNAETTTEVKAGDVVYVSYTYEYVEGTTTKKVTANYQKMILTDDALSQKIIADCKNVGTKKDFKITVDGVEYSYKNVVVNWVVNSESKLGEFKVEDFDSTKSVTDVTGTSRKLSDAKDGVLTYHVYPVYYVQAPEFNATLILDALTGANLNSTLFDVFEDENYKTTVDGKEVKLSTLI
jgi:hypothetical protein